MKNKEINKNREVSKEMYKNWKTGTLVVGMQNGTAFWKKIRLFLKMLNNK